MRQRIFYAVALGGAMLIVGRATPAGAAGYWNLPSTFCQCMGCGWGAGHHAPLVLGPASCQGWCAHKEQRLPHSPSPPYGWNCCYSDEHPFDAPTMLEPAPAPVAPATEPISRRHRPLFLR